MSERPVDGPNTPDRPTPAVPGSRDGDRGRRIVFGVLTAACLAGAIGYVAWASVRGRPAASGPSIVTSRTAAPGSPALTSIPSTSSPRGLDATSSPSATTGRSPRVVFQNVVRDDGYAKVAVAELSDPDGPRTITGLTCERVYFAAGRGLCLGSEFGLVTTYHAVIFDEDFVPQHRLALDGPPSRARISSDGRYGAATVFVFGHSYADAVFSTHTIIIDMASGATLGHLEEFVVERAGAEIRAPDFNFWGVTFAADSDRFYATLRTAGRTHLVEGDVETRRMRVLAENVECPSLSPDGKRIAFKKLVAEGPTWRLHVLELATMVETPLAEERSVDDQVEWLDDENVLYAIFEDTWTVASDGTGVPSIFLSEGLSPAVVR